jgi:hypothetical protein
LTIFLPDVNLIDSTVRQVRAERRAKAKTGKA